VRDLDQENAERATRDYTFKINGTIFHIRERVHRKRHAKLMDLIFGTYQDSFPIPGELDENQKPITIYRSPNQVESTEIMEAFLIDFLEPESHDAWRFLLQDEENPLTSEDLGTIAGLIIQVQGKRPLEPAPDSGTGAQSQSNGTQSTAASPSPGAISNA
jgi:hypothetical protein